MPASMIMAVAGSRLKVSGNSIATVATGQTPGSTPNNVARNTPKKQEIRFLRLIATPKPSPRLDRISMRRRSEFRPQVQRQAEQGDENADREHQEKEREARGFERTKLG